MAKPKQVFKIGDYAQPMDQPELRATIYDVRWFEELGTYCVQFETLTMWFDQDEVEGV